MAWAGRSMRSASACTVLMRSTSRIVIVIVAVGWPIAAPRIPQIGGATMRHFYSGENGHYYSGPTSGVNAKLKCRIASKVEMSHFFILE